MEFRAANYCRHVASEMRSRLFYSIQRLSDSWKKKIATNRVLNITASELASVRDIPGLDGLRAVSVLIVMIDHSRILPKFPGGFGVTVFFFISGFIITTLLLRELRRSESIDLRNFYIRRLLRLYPASFFFVLTVFASGLMLGHQVAITQFAGAVFYFVNYLNVFGPSLVAPELSHFWSLAVEMHFYLFFPFLLIFCAQREHIIPVVLSVVIVASLLFRFAGALMWPHLAEPYTYQATECRIDIIAFGALLATLLHSPNGERFAQAISHPAVFAGGVAILIFTMAWRNELFRLTLRYSLQGVALMAILTACVFGRRYLYIWGQYILNSRPFVYTGYISYSLYLWNILCLSAAIVLLGPSRSGLGVFFGWLLTFVAASCSYELLEKPIVKLRRRFGSSPRAYAS